MFVETEEFREFKEEMKELWQEFRKNPIKYILGAIISYVYIVALIILIP